MSSADYTVTLDSFEGPLDLLLYLIRRDEVDVQDIPISRITSSYLAFLESEGGITRMDVDVAAEFLVMAATLVEIKSRLISPEVRTPGQESESSSEQDARQRREPIDPRADLVKQLLAYKKYRDAATALEQRRSDWENRFASGSAGAHAAPIDPDEADEPVYIEDVNIVDLCRAFATIIETVDLNRIGEHQVKDDETPIQVYAADIIDQLKRQVSEAVERGDPSIGSNAQGTEFAKLFSGRSRNEAIGLFLAMLELIRQRQVVVRQDGLAAGIFVRLRDEADDRVERDDRDEVSMEVKP